MAESDSQIHSVGSLQQSSQLKRKVCEVKVALEERKLKESQRERQLFIFRHESLPSLQRHWGSDFGGGMNALCCHYL